MNARCWFMSPAGFVIQEDIISPLAEILHNFWRHLSLTYASTDMRYYTINKLIISIIRAHIYGYRSRFYITTPVNCIIMKKGRRCSCARFVIILVDISFIVVITFSFIAYDTRCVKALWHQVIADVSDRILFTFHSRAHIYYTRYIETKKQIDVYERCGASIYLYYRYCVLLIGSYSSNTSCWIFLLRNSLI